MHPRNPHQDRYDLKELSRVSPELASHVFVNQYGNDTIDFSNPLTVKLLNRAILKSFYFIQWWDIPSGYLCPPIPGRADTIHYLADLLATSNNSTPAKNVLAWDVGVGANCVYPLIGQHAYGWNFIGSEVDEVAFQSAQKIVRENILEDKIELRLQPDPECILTNLLKSSELIDIVLCNPPFHSSAEEAQRGTARKNKNLGLKKELLNFGGRNHELWVPGGEVAFVTKIIDEGHLCKDQCLWFSSLISKKESLAPLQNRLKKLKATEVIVFEMGQGQKVSRLLTWTFKDSSQHREWARKRWE